jgi:predicted DNA-binding protein
MSQKPLNDQGGDAVRVSVRLPDGLYSRLTAAVEQHEITISALMRSATEAELDRLEDRQLAEAAGVPP